jgi:uncharacterized protein YqeY
MSLKEQISQDTKAAMKARDKQRLGTLRLLGAAIKQKEVDDRVELSDDDITAIITKMIKQRKDSAEQYQQAGRDELAEQELYEIGVLESYLPEPLSEAELDAVIQATVHETGASSMADMGKVMNALRPKIAGRADMSVASAKIRALLG